MPPLNPNVPFNARPGAYFSVSTKSATAVSQLRELSGRYRVHVLADMLSSGTSDPSKPYLVTSQKQADQYFGARTGCARGYARVATEVTGGVEIYCTGIIMTGTPATALIKIIGTATGSGQIRVRICDYLAIADIADGDNASTIAASLKAAIDGLGSIPFTAGIGTDTITLTYATAGLQGNDKPIAVWISDSVTGVSASPGTITVTGTADGAGAGHTVVCNNKSVTYNVANTTAQNAGATGLAAEINADSAFHLKATAATNVVTLLYKQGHPVHRVSCSTTDGVQTVTAAVGTTGSGTPVLTTALNNLASADAMQEWVTIFNDDTSLESIIAHLRTYGNGYHMKEQFFTWGNTEGLTAAGALVSGLTPSVITPSDDDSTVGRYSALWCPNAFQQAFELACHRASARAVQRRPTKNFNFYAFHSNTTGIDLTFPDMGDWPDPPTTATARSTYFLCPLIVRRGQLCIESDVNTYGGTALKYRKSSYVHGIAHYRNTLKATLEDRFHDKEYVEHSEVRTPDCFNLQQLNGAIMDVKNALEFQNLFDGAAFVEDKIDVQIDPEQPGVILVGDPVLMPVELDRIQGVISPP
jgi:phage tail sheath gpL-like